MTLFASGRLRTATALALLLLCLVCVGCILLKNETQYRRLAPLPDDYKPVAVGAPISLPRELEAGTAWFLHFYNPDCPCSRFNVQHLRSLIAAYNDSVAIAVVVASPVDVDRATRVFGDRVKIIHDDNGALAQACGVYSTPQAAIVDANGALYYRGNYNISRYCTSRATSFAELSLLALLNRQPPPYFGALAIESYGCALDPEDRNLVSLY